MSPTVRRDLDRAVDLQRERITSLDRTAHASPTIQIAGQGRVRNGDGWLAPGAGLFVQGAPLLLAERCMTRPLTEQLHERDDLLDVTRARQFRRPRLSVLGCRAGPGADALGRRALVRWIVPERFRDLPDAERPAGRSARRRACFASSHNASSLM